MRTNGQPLRENEMVTPYVDLESVKEGAKKVFTKDRRVVIALTGSILAVLGVVLFALQGAMQTDTTIGTSPYLSSFVGWR